MKFLLLFMVTWTGHILVTSGAPFHTYDTTEVMTVPESKVIDFDNLTESERADLLRNQVNITAIRLQQQRYREAQRNIQRPGSPMSIIMSATDPNISAHVQQRKVIEKHIISNIKQNIEQNLMRNESAGHAGATHEVAFSPLCDLPKHSNQSGLDDDYTSILYFRFPYSKQHTSVSSAILRLYMNGNATDGWNRRDSDNCKDPSDQMIRVTASVFWRKKSKDNSSSERKKRICSSITTTRNFRGWITLDTLLAVKLWDKPNRNFVIAIDVQDQDDNPLPAAKFFQSTDCSEASKTNASATVLPWSFFRNSLSWTSDEMDDVPHVPRIDVMMHKIPQHHLFLSHSHHHRMFRSKPHYGGAATNSHNVRYRLENGSAAPTSSSAAAAAASSVGNSYELEEVEIKQHHHPSVHSHHSMNKPHKKRHLNHHRLVLAANSAESNEYFAASASLEERKL